MKILFKELFNYKLSIFMILVATYLSTTFELLLPLLLANALNVGISQNYGLEYIKSIAMMMLVLIIASIILNIIISFLITRTSTLVSANIRNKLFKKTLFLKNDDIHTFQVTSLITRTNQDIEQIKNFISASLSTIFKAPIILYSCIVVLINLNSNFFLLLFISIAILITFLIIIIIKLIPLSQKIQISIDNLNKHLKDLLTGYKIIKSYNNVEEENSKYKKENTNYLSTSKKAIKISSIINPFLTLIVNTVTITILFMCINLVKINSMEAGTIIATIQYILQILMAILMLAMILLNYPSIKISLSRINEVLTKEEYKQNNETKNFEIENISFDNVSFSYDNKEILKNINLSINKGENLGIIGLNGSGKSTLIKLLLKEKENFTGSIKINNTNLNNLSRKDITSNLTYVPQKPYLLKGSIIENIAFANNKLTLQDISKIIHCSNLEKFISDKKENLNYLIEENGANLSGGQKQRISLARALAKESNLIILDEPFSALDYKTEKEIFTKLNTFYKEKSFVIISQRISSILNCSKIVVLDKGKIIAQGTHEELLENCSLYKDIYSIQKEAIEYDI